MGSHILARATARRLTFGLLLLLALLMLDLTGLGVFRLYFGFEWMAGASSSGDVFSLRIRGGNAFNLFEASYGIRFWLAQALLAALALCLPLFRVSFGTLISLMVASLLVLMHHRGGVEVRPIPLEFELLIVIVLYLIYVLLSYVAEVRDRQHVARLLSQYVPPELVSAYGRDPRAILRGDQREISVLFCDVVGFSERVETLSPSDLTDWLNGFFDVTSRVVVRYRGTIDKYIGDSIMAMWGAPSPSTTHAFDALSAAFDIQRELVRLNRRFEAEGLPAIQAGIGLCTGLANVGPLGSEYRMDYTAVGDAVNVAQRLQMATRRYGVSMVVSESTAKALPDQLFRELDTLQVKGRAALVTVYEPLGSAADASESLRERLAMHQSGIDASRAGDWQQARACFSTLREDWGPASIYDRYLAAIDELAVEDDSKRRQL